MKVAILGAEHPKSAELIRLLLCHPKVDGIFLSASKSSGGAASLYPHLSGLCGKTIHETLLPPGAAVNSADFVFSALPCGASESFALGCLDKGVSFIDFSACFRFEDEQVYEAWYKRRFQYRELHRRSVYGLTELNREKIRRLSEKGALVIGNAGCLSTACTLAMLPALREGLGSGGTVVANCSVGNAGRTSEMSDLSVIDESTAGIGTAPSQTVASDLPSNRRATDIASAHTMFAFGVGVHRATPEIMRNVCQIEEAAQTGLSLRNVIVTPHHAPLSRGLLATLYIPLRDSLSIAMRGRTDRVAPPNVFSGEIAERTEEIRKVYENFYKNEPFVRVLPAGLTARTSRVRSSNFCDISVHLDISGSVLIICAAIDQMVKGAAGQAIQNMNLVQGFDETSGLTMPPELF